MPVKKQTPVVEKRQCYFMMHPQRPKRSLVRLEFVSFESGCYNFRDHEGNSYELIRDDLRALVGFYPNIIDPWMIK